MDHTKKHLDIPKHLQAIQRNFTHGSSRRLIWLGFCVITLFSITFASYHQFGRRDHNLPSGCDEFGYLNMAKAISEGKMFGDHARRPFINELLADLRVEYSNADDYRWMVAPHAYHVSPYRDKIINQYPPGVGLLLAPVPLENRRSAYPMICVLICCVAILLAGCLDAGRFSFLVVAVLPLVAAGMYFDPMRFELERVASLAPTYGLLIGSGWLLPRRPLWSLAFISASTIFRLPNSLLFAPMGLAGLLLSEPRVNSISCFARRAIGIGVAAFLGGFGFYLLYAYLLLGNPFAVTYSRLDQEFASFPGISKNLYFYFVDKNQWLFPHLGALAFLGLVCAFRKKYSWLVFGVALCIFNYAFYIFHKVQIDYYPYATVFLCVGLALGVADIERLSPRLRAVVISGGVAVGFAMALSGLPGPGTALPLYAEKAAPYHHAFSGYDVVWAEAHSGTVEYTTGRAGFRYNWGSDVVRKHVMLWMLRRGYSQAVWIDDDDMKPFSEIKQFLNSSKIQYTKKYSEGLGAYLEISQVLVDTVSPVR